MKHLHLCTPRQLSDAQFVVGDRDAILASGQRWDKVILWVGLAAVIAALYICAFGGAA